MPQSYALGRKLAMANVASRVLGVRLVPYLRTDLTLENLTLRQQLALLRRRSKRPQFGRLDCRRARRAAAQWRRAM